MEAVFRYSFFTHSFEVGEESLRVGSRSANRNAQKMHFLKLHKYFSEGKFQSWNSTSYIRTSALALITASLLGQAGGRPPSRPFVKFCKEATLMKVKFQHRSSGGAC